MAISTSGIILFASVVSPSVSSSKSNMAIVTGAAGFIGSNLVSRLSGDSKILAIDNLHTGNVANLKDSISTGNVEFVEKDASEILTVGKEADTVYHLGFYSASPMYRDNPLRVSEIVKGIISVMEYARKNDSRVVFSSTSSIYNGIEPPHREDIIPGVTDFYTEARIASERISELYSGLYGLDVSAMRFFSVYGEHEEYKKTYANLVTQFYWDMRKGESPVIYGDGEQKRDFVYVGDVVNALVLAAEKNRGFNVYNVGYGKNYTLNEMVGKLNGLLGTSIKPNYIEMPVKNYVMETLADTTKAAEKIGFRAGVSLDQGLLKLKEYYK